MSKSFLIVSTLFIIYFLYGYYEIREFEKAIENPRMRVIKEEDRQIESEKEVELKEMIEKSRIRIIDEKEREEDRQIKKEKGVELKKILYEQAAHGNSIDVSNRIEKWLEKEADMTNEEGCFVFYVRMYQKEIVNELKNRYKEPYWAIYSYETPSLGRNLDDEKYMIRMYWSLNGNLDCDNLSYIEKYLFNGYKRAELYYYNNPLYNKYISNCQNIGHIVVGNTIDYTFYTNIELRSLPIDTLLIDYINDECHQDENKKYICPNLVSVCSDNYLCSYNNYD